MKALLAVTALATLAGCSLLQPTQPAPADNWTRWVCDTQAEVLWRFADAQRDQVDVRLGGGDQVYRLKAEPGARVRCTAMACWPSTPRAKKAWCTGWQPTI